MIGLAGCTPGHDQTPPPSPPSTSQQAKPALSAWSDTSPNKQKLVDYVSRVTKKGSDDYIPPEDRVAVFDQDGTILVEGDVEATIMEVAVALHRADELVSDGTIKKGDKLYEQYQTLKKQLAADPSMSNTSADVLYSVMGGVFAGMPAEDYVDYVTDFMSTKQSDLGITWKDGFYKPMIELIDYLDANGFTSYIVSASEREAVWGAMAAVLDLPRSQIIGGDIDLKGSTQSDDSADYSVDDTLVREGTYADYNYDSEKVFKIYRQTGTIPVLAFGNSGSDYPMMNFTMSNDYPAMAFLVVHDDADREYEYDVDSRRSAADENGWGAISMKDEFSTLWMNG